jgi:glycosyltransferase involved in cell wall biosynthesis
MNVAIFTNTYAPYVNGVANCVKAFRECLTDAGHEVVVFTPWPLDKQAEDDDENIVRFPAIPAPGDYDYSLAVPFAPKVVKTLRNAKFDIVHTQHPIWVGSWGAWYARWAEIPLVTTVHTQYELFSHLFPLPEPLVDMYLRSQVTRYCNKCHVVMTPAESARERLLQQGVTAPIEIVRNPVNVAQFAAADGGPVRAALGIAPEEIVYGFVGRLAPEKNVEFVLRAVAAVLRQIPRGRCVIVGGGVQLEPLQELAAKLGGGDRVIFTGEIEHARIAEYQAAIDVFVVASLSEGQPLAYTEALSAGTPIVALRAPGATDIIMDGYNGRLIDPEAGVEAMAAALGEFASDREHLQRLSRGAHDSAKAFEPTKTAADLARIYQMALDRAREAARKE